VGEDLDQLPEIITAPRTDAIYNCHAYLTKVPIAAISPFIEAFTEPGDVVADFFAGSGMTGLAAMGVNRRARLSDISVLGRHIATGYLTDVPTRELQKATAAVFAQARKAIGNLYATKRATDGKVVEVVRTVWSFTYQCPSCAFELVYFKHLDAKGNPPKACPGCKGAFVRRTWGRLKDVPVEVVVRGEDDRLKPQDPSDYDVRKIKEASNDRRLEGVPSLSIDENREMYSRSGLGKAGMTETRKFFSPRNGIALVELWRAINELEDDQFRQKLRFAFTAILPRASKRYQWSAQRPLNAQNQTYYIAPVYYEWNVFELFERKVDAGIRAASELFTSTSLFDAADKVRDVTYDLASADKLKHLGDESVDYVFTDPPFGSNIFYSDMNLFHEAWLGEATDHVSEAVVHTTGKRKNGAEERYEALLRKAFQEAWRVLKPGKYMSVVFGNSSGRIWGLVQRALRDAGFRAAPSHVAILDKGQRSVKGLNSGSEGVVTVDLILTVQKPARHSRPETAATLANGDAAALIEEAVKELSADDARNASHVYARVLRKAIQRHLVVDDLHLGDVLMALRNAGYSIDRKTGLLQKSGASRKHVA
jgi:DNA methylase